MVIRRRHVGDLHAVFFGSISSGRKQRVHKAHGEDQGRSRGALAARELFISSVSVQLNIRIVKL